MIRRIRSIETHRLRYGEWELQWEFKLERVRKYSFLKKRSYNRTLLAESFLCLLDFGVLDEMETRPNKTWRLWLEWIPQNQACIQLFSLHNCLLLWFPIFLNDMPSKFTKMVLYDESGVVSNKHKMSNLILRYPV